MPRGGFETGRLFGPDLARGIALLGMFAAHISFAETEQFYDGRPSILFATVAGVSLGLITGGAQPERIDRTRARLSVAIRGLALIVIGVALTSLIDPPLVVILEYYGLGFFLLLPLLFAPAWVLVLVGGLLAAAMPPLVAWLRDHTDPTAVPDLLRGFTDWTVYGVYPMSIWLVFLLTGLLCARADLFRRRTQLLLIVGGAVVAALGYGASALLPGVSAAAHSGSLAEVLGSGGLAVAAIGTATVLGGLPGAVGRGIRIVLFPVAAAGAMALTLYIAHALILAWLRGLATDAVFWEYPEPTLVLMIAGTLLVATLWRLLLGAGPVERLLRLLTRIPRPRRGRRS